MQTDTKRPELTFDGKGINGPDEYRSRIATFQNDEAAQSYGRLLAAAPELLKMLREAVSHDTALKAEWKVPPRLLADMQAAIAKASV